MTTVTPLITRVEDIPADLWVVLRLLLSMRKHNLLHRDREACRSIAWLTGRLDLNTLSEASRLLREADAPTPAI